MPGTNAKPTLDSYVAVGKESTFGTYNTATSAIEALTVGFKSSRNSQKLETLFKNRGFAKRVLLDKVTAGSIEAYAHPEDTFLLVANGLGGAISTSSLTASAFTHSVSAGNMDTTTAIQSLAFNVRKGDEHTFQYSGGRVDTLKISGAVGELVKISADLVFKDSTIPSNDLATALSVSSVAPFTYVDGTFQYAATENSLTSTVAEKIQSFELTISNGLKPDAGRELGSEVLSTLPLTRRNVELKITQRFDTTTTLDRHLQATTGAVALLLQGESATAEATYSMIFRMPKVYQNGADPELSSPEDILSAEIAYDVVLDDPNTTTGKDIGLTVINKTSSY